MSDLRSLYQEVILDHYKNPRNFGPLDSSNREAEGYNPLCGDQIKVYVEVDGDTVKKVTFEGAGCAISTASASLMTEAIEGKSVAAAEALFRVFHELLTGSPSPNEEQAVDDTALGKLEVLSGVREYPVRIKCATLAWHALRSALKGDEKPVSTE